MEEAHSSEISINIHHTTWCQTQEDYNLMVTAVQISGLVIEFVFDKDKRYSECVVLMSFKLICLYLSLHMYALFL
jgi:hypothetical protein